MEQVMPEVAIATSNVSASCAHPGFTTMSERMKVANDMKVMGRHSCSASHMVRMNEASGIRAATAGSSGRTSSFRGEPGESTLSAVNRTTPPGPVGHAVYNDADTPLWRTRRVSVDR